MNLHDQNNVRRYWPASGNVIAGTHQFEALQPCWSPPRLRIFDHSEAAHVDDLVSRFLASPSVHIIAVSPAVIGPGWWPYDHSPGGEPVPLFAVSVLYQERLTPAASDSLDQTP
jgi:hypothetical protein